MYRQSKIVTYLILTALFFIVSSLGESGCENAVRSGFDEKKNLLIIGYVVDIETKKGLAGAQVNFYSITDDSVSTVYTNEQGAYSMRTFEVYCVDFVPMPEDIDWFVIPHDRYFISATKSGYDTVRFGAFSVNLQCFDIKQQVDFRLQHLNHIIP